MTNIVNAEKFMNRNKLQCYNELWIANNSIILLRITSNSSLKSFMDDIEINMNRIIDNDECHQAITTIKMRVQYVKK